MDRDKNIFDYLAQVLIVFGFSTLMLNIFCIIFGSAAQEFSSMFALGSRGLTVETAFQFFCVSVLIVGLRFLFFTETLIKKLPFPLRIVGMLGCVLVIMIAFIIRFQWFPADLWIAWALFFICFLFSFVCSYLVMLLKEKTENRKLTEALERLKKKEASNNE